MDAQTLGVTLNTGETAEFDIRGDRLTITVTAPCVCGKGGSRWALGFVAAKGRLRQPNAYKRRATAMLTELLTRARRNAANCNCHIPRTTH